MSKNGIKLLITGLENSGKTRLISGIKNALVVSTDNKAFRGKVPHFRYSYYNGLEDFIETISTKIEAYQEKMNKLPETLVIDSVTHLTNAIEKYCNDKYTGFNVYSNLSKDILGLNAFIEDELIPAGINVVMTAHVQYDVDTAKYKIPASGSFGKSGSWLSVTDNASYLFTKGSKRMIAHKDIKLPCRSLLDDFPESETIEDYDINKHINELEKLVTDSEEWVI